MYDLRPNLEPGNPDGHTVLRYLVEAKQMPLDVAIERVYQAVSKFAQEYRSDQNKLMAGMVVSGVLGLPIFFPFGVPSLLIAGALAGSVFHWQELGAMRDRLKPEYSVLKGSVLLEQFIKWLATELRERREQAHRSGQFQPDALTPANIIAAYEHTVEAVMNGEHLENNASDPILALFVLKLRQHSNHLPTWVIDAFRQLEQAEVCRANDVARASLYMWGNLEERYRERFNQPPQNPPPQIGHNTRLGAVEVPSQSIQGEGEQSLGKPPTLPPAPETTDRDTGEKDATVVREAFTIVLREDRDFSFRFIHNLARAPLSKIFGAVPGSGKTTMQRMLIKEVATQFPLSQFYITQTKRDPFLGIESIPGVVVFSAPRRDNGEPILDQAERVSKILEYRSSFKACQAKRLFKDKPVILLLCDYSDSLQQCSSEVKAELVKIIQQIRFNGRALNVQVWLDVQVLNQLEALGLVGSDSRSSGIILTLGAERVEEGGDFGVVENAIFGSSETFPSGFKAKLKPHLETFKVRSRETNRTLVVTPFMDANAFLLPDWSALEDEKLPDSVLLQLERNVQQQKTELSSKHQRESFPNSVPPIPDKSNSEPDSSKVTATTDSEADGQRSTEVGDFKVSDELGEPLKSIWLFAKKKKGWVTVKDIYKNELAALKGKNVKQIRQYLGLLADTGYGEIDELDKDKPKSDSAVGFRAY
jgi:hypothetical protein